ncbi:MAG: zinc-dependent peptidase [Halioglobus sp.]|nr:zinc-dependent peptidase [Halioglobus sp.]
MELPSALLPLLPVLLAVAAFAISHYYRRWRRQRILDAPFPDAWRRHLVRRLPVYQRLSASEQSHLQQMIQLFLQEKAFYGCAGLEITDEIRVCIAAQACLLSLGRQGPLYPKLTAILVYPGGFFVEREAVLEDGTVADDHGHMLGESWDNGRVILSWDDVARGAEDFGDGHNVVLHEFAHQLDAASGATNGAPPLWRNSYQAWATVFSDNFEDLRRRAHSGRDTVIDTYGATNEAEFFAVATETFFERPQELHKVRPELFDELQRYYRVDPRNWKA